ncbi:MAG: tRNA (adenosine(37)-N6)-threonylcarbamoyltransferase complex dimerization subunit type 1 TsaB [Paludibacteraceae bacterium]|nr:tRNA (adenosine(37)-N6)-threonylcarbamoyltransferase complex dimerization subunit type 1 TsaB [Paludibacteraceae bacterium]
MTILCIETSTNCCSAAITIDGQAVASKENLEGANHASELPVFIEQLLDTAREQGWTLDAVAFSQGPGSYTGLRIGAATAKGICYGLNIPLIPVDTLQILCAAVKDQQSNIDGILCPMLDARRMEVYTAMYQPNDLKAMSKVEAKIINEQSFCEELKKQTIYFFGNGAEKCKTIIQFNHAKFIDNIVPQAKYMGALAEQATQLDIKQMAYYEPFYLKEFVAAPSHIKGLN